jgi:hypothetical protein
MNDLEFRRHLKDLVHGHHHPEEHDWDQKPAVARKTAPVKRATAKRRAGRKSSRTR